MVLLGDVGQREEVGERSRDGQRRFHRQVPQDAGERTDIVGGTRPRMLRQRSHPLDRVEQRLSLAQPQRVAEQLAQHPHIVPQRRVWIHGAIVSQSAVVSRRSSVAVVGRSRQSQSTVTVDSHSRQSQPQSAVSVAFLEHRTPTSLHLVVGELRDHVHLERPEEQRPAAGFEGEPPREPLATQTLTLDDDSASLVQPADDAPAD